MYSNLLKEVEYAKNSMLKELLYQVHGRIQMAYELKAITGDEMLDLDRMVIRDGLNNPEFIRHWNKEYFEGR
jgi:hypothetical protein